MPVAGILAGSRLIDGTTPDVKLQTISTAGKVANSATTATDVSVANAIVTRDASGGFGAGQISSSNFSGPGILITTLNAAALTTGTVPNARLSNITNTEISATAAIAYSKLALAGAIVNGDIAAAAGIVDTKLATIATAGKVSNSATTGTAASTASTLVLRDAAGRAQFADPAAAQDAATKAYVDATLTGLDLKASCRIASTANLGLTGLTAIDGVTPVAGDRVLAKNQTTASANGIYVAAAGAWSRATDADNTPAGEVTAGMFTFIEEGTTNADTGWVLITDNPITLGTTSLTFTQFSQAGVVVAGAGLTKTGTSIDVVAGDSTITVAADDIRVGSNSLLNVHIGAAAAIAYSKLALAGSIVNADIAAGAAIADTKLATISTAGKVANSATTAVSAPTVSAIIARDAAGRAQVVDPAVAADIATKGYVDSAAGTNGTIVDNEIPAGTINGTNPTFTLAFTPIAGSVQLYLGGLRLLPTTHFSVSAATITMVSGYEPITGESFIAAYRK